MERNIQLANSIQTHRTLPRCPSSGKESGEEDKNATENDEDFDGRSLHFSCMNVYSFVFATLKTIIAVQELPPYDVDRFFFPHNVGGNDMEDDQATIYDNDLWPGEDEDHGGPGNEVEYGQEEEDYMLRYEDEDEEDEEEAAAEAERRQVVLAESLTRIRQAFNIGQGRLPMDQSSRIGDDLDLEANGANRANRANGFMDQFADAVLHRMDPPDPQGHREHAPRIEVVGCFIINRHRLTRYSI